MRKNLLFVLGLALTMTAFSQVPTETIWSKSFTPITANLKMPQNQVMAVDASGAAIVTGTMMQSFTFAGKTIEALTSNANYIAKYSGTGEELWAVVIDGGNVSAITTDPQGNIYLAGSIGESINFGTTNGDDVTKEGNIEISSIFLAKYDPNGILLTAKTIIPNKYDTGGDSYDTPGITIPQLTYNNGNLYAAISNLSSLVILDNDIKLEGHYYNEIIDWGDDMIFTSTYFCNSIHILSFTNDFIAEKQIANASMPENEESSKGNALSPRLVLQGNKIFIGFTANGSIKMTSSSDSKNFIYSSITEEGETFYNHGFIISSIDMNTGNITSQNYESLYKSSRLNPLILSNLFINNDNLITIGTYETENNPFDPEQSKTGVIDMTIASLDKDLKTIWTVTSGYNEGSGNFTDSEEYNSNAIFGNKLVTMATIYNYTPKPDNKKYISNTYLMDIDLTSGTASDPVVTPVTTTINTGIAGNGTNLLSASATPSESKMTFTMAGKIPDAIGEIEGNSTSVITIFNTVVKDAIQLSEAADATITNLSGIIVKAVKATDQINISNLPTGSYFVTINGKTTKIQKI